MIICPCCHYQAPDGTPWCPNCGLGKPMNPASQQLTPEQPLFKDQPIDENKKEIEQKYEQKKSNPKYSKATIILAVTTCLFLLTTIWLFNEATATTNRANKSDSWRFLSETYSSEAFFYKLTAVHAQNHLGTMLASKCLPASAPKPAITTELNTKKEMTRDEIVAKNCASITPWMESINSIQGTDESSYTIDFKSSLNSCVVSFGYGLDLIFTMANSEVDSVHLNGKYNGDKARANNIYVLTRQLF